MGPATVAASSNSPDIIQAVRVHLAANRVSEAAVVADRLGQETAKKQIKDTQTIESLLDSYRRTFDSLATSFSQGIDRGQKFPAQGIEWGKRLDVQVYLHLMQLRLEAPPGTQSNVLA